VEDRIDFLKALLDEPGPSGFEVRPARVWRKEAARFADRIWSDVHGNSYAVLGESRRPLIMLAGHVDEIGLQVTHVDKEGFLYLDGIGGWDSQVLVGQRVRILGRDGAASPHEAGGAEEGLRDPAPLDRRGRFLPGGGGRVGDPRR